MQSLTILRAMLLTTMLSAQPVLGQSEPVNGMRSADLRTHAIVDASIVISPGMRLEKASIVMRDGVIIAVGENVDVPPDARIWSGSGLTVYAGLIDAALLIPTNDREASPGAHWNERVHPEISMIDQPLPDEKLRKELRSMGFTAAAVYPDTGIFRGTGSVIALAENEAHALSYLDRSAMAVGLDRARGFGRRMYPNSLMGAIALIRQTLYDAQWHEAGRRVYERHADGNEPPIRADALDALQLVINRYQPVLFDVSDELNALRADRMAREFNLDAILLGSGLEFRRLDEIVAMKRPLIVPLAFPEAPDLSTIAASDSVTLREMMTWEQAPTNPRRLIRAGAKVSLTTHRLEKRADFLKNLRLAIRHGLTEDEALASLTTTPAAMLGLDGVLGTIATGKAANLVVVEGSLFEKDAKIRDTWINGRRHEISKAPEFVVKGSYAFWTNRGHFHKAKIDTEKSSISISIEKDKTVKAKKLKIQKDQVSFIMDGEVFDTEGYVQISGIIIGDTITGTGIMPDGDRFQFTFEPDPEADDEADDDEAEERVTAEEGDEDEDEDPDEIIGGLPPEELVFPLGAFGLTHPPELQNIYLHHATLWTEGPQGIIDNGCLIVENGKITHVGPEPAGGPPQGYLVIDAQGQHVTPGLLDCHSHTGISGGVNEGSQSVTAEVRIGDVVNPDDINFYRQLAGGVTTINQLHGSANPIGGQNSVIKLKWGGRVEDMRIPDAIEGIKFALGENPKRSEGRYPDTRMGVETVIRDAFTAACDYKDEWDRYLALPTDERERTMPPKRDLELDTLVEILQGDRLVHCHSYRQDEILMLVRVADDFGFTIGTFQHVLEGYKIADVLAQHGAGASSFSDWWAYKVEVMDAIPFNGALMTDVGVVVSFNSDSSELARRMNTEAAKAVRYGGLDPHEALKLVTINPAKQLRIDHRLGSLEVGKDGDFAIWSDNPLSTYARCVQTWIEGARYFDLRIDEMYRSKVKADRQRLIQKILAQADKKGGKDKGEKGGDRFKGHRRPSEQTLLIQGDCDDTTTQFETLDTKGDE